MRERINFSLIPEWIGANVVGVGEITRSGFRDSVRNLMDLSDSNTLFYFLLNNTGDFAGSYFVTLFTHGILNRLAKSMPEKLRMGISMAVACGATVATEVFIPQSLGGDPRGDIPMGVAGTFFYLGLNVIGNRSRGHNLYSNSIESGVTATRS